jgi:DNA-binding response OmpR family regulator
MRIKKCVTFLEDHDDMNAHIQFRRIDPEGEATVMDSGMRCGVSGCGVSTGSAQPAPVKRVWVVGGAFDSWWELALTLRQSGIEVKPAGTDVDLTALSEQADRDRGVIVVDLLESVERGIRAITCCRSVSSPVSVIAVVTDPSLELAHRLRDLGVFCLAVHPLDAGKMREVLEDAFLHIEKMRAAGPYRKKVLIVDDDPDYRESLQAFLQNEGFAVCCAATGSQGLERAKAEKPDLIVLDIMMENMWAGYEVNQALKFQSGYESVRRIPIVMVSSIQAHPAERFARSEDASMVCPDVYLTKPLDMKKFLETVRSLLR